MLTKLKIKNVALISEETINFDKNLNIISGETGAGKSIILDCISLILGARSDKNLIRNNEEFLKVDATFININQNAINYLKELEFEADDCLLISRKITIEGKNEIKLNGEIIPLNVLKKLTSLLIASHSQNENLLLLNKDEQLNLIDNYSNIENLLIENEQIFNSLKVLNNKINELNKDDSIRNRELDLLNYQINEIEEANLKESEENSLKEELMALKNHEKINDLVVDIKNDFVGNGISGGISTLLHNFKNNLTNLTKYSTKCEELKTRLDSAYFEIEDIFNEIEDIFELDTFSEARLEEVDTRLETYKKLHAKYGLTIEEIFAFLNSAKEKRDYIVNCDEHLQNLLKEKNSLVEKAYKKAIEISNIRRKNAKTLENLILSEIKELSMPNARIEFEFNKIPTLEEFEKIYSKNGIDSVTILFSANLGENLKPLSLIASGGELSRLMLAVKTVCSPNNDVQTLIFDEIDTGVSGNAGLNISKKLAKISKNKQVIAVSHLFQICAMADKNILVKKNETNNRTLTTIKELNEEDEINELSRFLSATDVTTTALENAKEVKNWCNNYKKSI